MTKTLKIALGAYGVGITVAGFLHFFFAEVDVEIALAASLVAVGPFLFTAARDPIRQIQWVRFAIVFALLFVGVSVYVGAIRRGEFRSVVDGIAIHGTFATLLLIFYPRQAERGGEQSAIDSRRRGSVMEVTD
jgi:hypothetical protein